MDISNLTIKHEFAERQFIAWMVSTDEFIDVSDDYFVGTEERKLYQNYKNQYYENGSFISTNIPEGLYNTYCECLEMATSAKPDIVLKELKKYHMIRELYKSFFNADKIIQVDKDKILDCTNMLSGQISKLLTDIEESHEYNHQKSVYDYMKYLEYSYKHGCEMRGISSHLPDIDNVISGWERGKKYLISGLEKLGKSRFVRNLLSTWLNKGYGCCIFMLEEDANAIHECVLANRCVVNTDTLGTRSISEVNLRKVLEEGNKYMMQPLYISTKSAITPQFIKSTIQRQKIKFKKNSTELMVVVVDYIQRMSSSGESRHEETEKIASELADIARDENVIMIEVSQMSSGAEKHKQLPLHTQIRYGKVFKESVDCIITFDDPVRMGREDDGFVIGKDYKKIRAHIIQRKGISDVYIDLRAELQYSSFHNFVKG